MILFSWMLSGLEFLKVLSSFYSLEVKKGSKKRVLNTKSTAYDGSVRAKSSEVNDSANFYSPIDSKTCFNARHDKLPPGCCTFNKLLVRSTKWFTHADNETSATYLLWTMQYA